MDNWGIQIYENSHIKKLIHIKITAAGFAP